MLCSVDDDKRTVVLVTGELLSMLVVGSLSLLVTELAERRIPAVSVVEDVGSLLDIRVLCVISVVVVLEAVLGKIAAKMISKITHPKHDLKLK